MADPPSPDAEAFQNLLTIEPDADRIDDEGYQSSTTSSLLSSVASEIKEGRLKHGRIFASYGEHGKVEL
jgi:hypothetical protein